MVCVNVQSSVCPCLCVYPGKVTSLLCLLPVSLETDCQKVSVFQKVYTHAFICIRTTCSGLLQSDYRVVQQCIFALTSVSIRERRGYLGGNPHCVLVKTA